MLFCILLILSKIDWISESVNILEFQKGPKKWLNKWPKTVSKLLMNCGCTIESAELRYLCLFEGACVGKSDKCLT